MEKPNHPAWLNYARRYYTHIGDESADPVTVFDWSDNEAYFDVSRTDQEVSNDKPGTPCLQLEPHFRFVRVLEVEGQEQGIIRSEGLVPGRFVMRRNGDPLWKLTVRSIVRKRHEFEPAVGVKWTFDTPFFWWQHLKGATGGVPRLLGEVGPTMRFWFMWVEPGKDKFDLLAAVAFMHRKWWRW